MEVRTFKRTDDTEIRTVLSWWKSRSDGINPDFLSDFGYMVWDGERPLVACFLFPIVGSKIAWLGWPVASPESTKEERDSALPLLFSRMHRDASLMGYAWIWTTSGHPGVQKRLESSGYALGDVGINQYWKEL